MERRFEHLFTPHKVKMGAVGCPRNCAEATVKDIGLIGVEGGWQVVVGGAAGKSVRKADLLTTVETTEQALEASELFFQYYRENANYLERTYDFVERLGIEKVRKETVYAPDAVREALLDRLLQVEGALPRRLAGRAATRRPDAVHSTRFRMDEVTGMNRLAGFAITDRCDEHPAARGARRVIGDREIAHRSTLAPRLGSGQAIGSSPPTTSVRTRADRCATASSPALLSSVRCTRGRSTSSTGSVERPPRARSSA